MHFVSMPLWNSPSHRAWLKYRAKAIVINVISIVAVPYALHMYFTTKAYTDHCNIKMSIKIMLIVFISTVFHKILTTAVAYALFTKKKKQEVSNFREILAIQHCPNTSRKFKSNQFIYNICTHNSQCIPQMQGENTSLIHKNCENLSLFYFLPRQAKSIFFFVFNFKFKTKILY